jgi:hypothetical protein
MPSYVKGGVDLREPYGHRNFLRSVQDVKTKAYTIAASSVKEVTIDGHAGQKVLPKGVLMAKITSGDDAGKIGPFSTDVAVTDGREAVANIVGLNNTDLPWQLMEHDVEGAVVYEASVVQAWCLMDTAAGWAAVGNTQAAATFGAGAAAKSVRLIWE